MKKIFYLFVVAIALTACSKNNEPAVTTYQIVNNVSVSTSIADLDGSMYQVIVLGYNNDNEVIQTDNIDKVASNGGETDKMKVSDNVTKLKVSFEFLPTSSSYYSQMQRTYLVQVYYVTKGQNTLITVTNSTTVSQSSTTSGASQINLSPELSTQLHTVQQSIAR